MRIIELCRKYGLSRKTVHLYIKSGLLKPAKLDNNYFDFKESDIRRLELIIKLRKAGVSIENIDCIFKYPSCANFFLFKQRYQIKNELNKYNNEFKNINTIIGNIPPNGTDKNIEEITEQLFTNGEETFEDIDELLTARMAATFLFTPFMGQKVDDYREFIWNKIVKTSRLELKPYLKEIATHLSCLDGWMVDHFSSSLAKLFIELSKDRYEDTYNYLKNEVEIFATDKTYRESWDKNYNSYIIPFKKILNSCDTFLREYNSFYTDCMERFPIISERIISQTDIKNLNFDLTSAPFNDLFILFTYRYSVFFSPFLSSPRDVDNNI